MVCGRGAFPDLPLLCSRAIAASFSTHKQSFFIFHSCAPDLTEDMLLDGSWKTKEFKAFNLDALGLPVNCGTLHPLLKVREEYRQIFLEMGFEEMPTNRYVERCEKEVLKHAIGG